VPVYGGQPIDRQFRALKLGAHVVVGTPGRVLDHLRRGSLDLSVVRLCVLDEADEMLALGFIDDIEAIFAELPEERQMALFSATMPPRIAALAKKYLRNPERVAIQARKRTVETTNQTYYEVPAGRKLDALARVLDMETPGSTIVFCRTRKETEEVADALRVRGYAAEALHGEMVQAERDRTMRRFREGQSDLLVATDVAARGLDIDTVTHVVNYDIPWDVEQYIHRIGRTGRAGRSGDAITLVEPRERRQLRQIEFMIGARIKPARIPTAADIAARRREVFKDSLREALEAGEFDGQLGVVEELVGEYDTAEVAAAALHLLWEMWVGTPAEVSEEAAADGEQPEAGMTRLFVGMGRQDGLRPGDLVGAIANEVGISGKAVGAIDILDRTAFVEVPSDRAPEVIEALGRTKLRGKRVRVQVARP
jgi:ATP-dependent RNA helicase DeaD